MESWRIITPLAPDLALERGPGMPGFHVLQTGSSALVTASVLALDAGWALNAALGTLECSGIDITRETDRGCQRRQNLFESDSHQLDMTSAVV